MHPSGAGAHNHAVHTVMGEDFIGPPLCSHVLMQALGTAVLAGACVTKVPQVGMHAAIGSPHVIVLAGWIGAGSHSDVSPALVVGTGMDPLYR